VLNNNPEKNRENSLTNELLPTKTKHTTTTNELQRVKVSFGKF
jgi:hypothetical protein